MTPIKTNSISTDSVCPKTGKLKYGLTNEYMFRAILQSNEYVLRNLIAALLHLEETQIQKVEILNPIKIGESIQDKEFQMDIHILLNDASMMNLEMQVADYGNWKERSLSYMCRGFDNLKKGDDYINVKPIVHVSFLNFSLPDLLPEFYGTYYVMNEKTHQASVKYSSDL